MPGDGDVAGTHQDEGRGGGGQLMDGGKLCGGRSLWVCGHLSWGGCFIVMVDGRGHGVDLMWLVVVRGSWCGGIG